MAKKKQTKSDTVVKLLTGPMPWRNKTDKQIAAKVGCSVSYVGKIRKTIQDEFYGHLAEKFEKVRESPNTTEAVSDAPLDVHIRSEILEQAKQYVTVDREATHGNMKNNFMTIAELWTAYLNHYVTSEDVAAMMTLLKIARLKSNPHSAEHWIDACGYMACGGELATQKDHK